MSTLKPPRTTARATVAALLLAATTTAGVAMAQGTPMIPAPTPVPGLSPAGMGMPLANTAWTLSSPDFLLMKDPLLSFDPVSVRATTRCNVMNGSFTVAVPNRLTINLDPNQTQPTPVACSKRQQKDSDRYVNMLNRVTGYTLSSNGQKLTLKGEAGTLKLKRTAYTNPDGSMPAPTSPSLPMNMQPH